MKLIDGLREVADHSGQTAQEMAKLRDELEREKQERAKEQAVQAARDERMKMLEDAVMRPIGSTPNGSP